MAAAGVVVGSPSRDGSGEVAVTTLMEARSQAGERRETLKRTK